MSIAFFLKENLKNIPPNVGKFINHLPYEYRPGLNGIYKKRKQDIRYIENANSEEKDIFVFDRVSTLVNFAYSNIQFYKEHYNKIGFNPKMLKSFSDIDKIPIITKSILNQYDIEQRSYEQKSRYIVNTGGSSGSPFGFYIEPSSMGHEWAHMHTIWEKLGYKVSDFKFGFGGRSDVKDIIDYDVVRNSFAIDLYAPFEQVCRKLTRIANRYNIKYLHGYPSSIYDFALYCEKHDNRVVDLLRKSLKGAFLGSEYPHQHYRETIEKVFNIKTISWYGHTERAVLAYEKEIPFTYEPFLSYGFTEVLQDNNEEFNLIGTSYYNFASPLIRYNTEDIVENPIFEKNILKSFKISKGRSGEFVIDKNSKNINLTALVFGRHHELFNYSKFIQVKQIEEGVINIYYVSDTIDEANAYKLFDMNNLNFDISFKKIDEPIRSISGKVNLLIK